MVSKILYNEEYREDHEERFGKKICEKRQYTSEPIFFGQINCDESAVSCSLSDKKDIRLLCHGDYSTYSTLFSSYIYEETQSLYDEIEETHSDYIPFVNLYNFYNRRYELLDGENIIFISLKNIKNQTLNPMELNIFCNFLRIFETGNFWQVAIYRGYMFEFEAPLLNINFLDNSIKKIIRKRTKLFLKTLNSYELPPLYLIFIFEERNLEDSDEEEKSDEENSNDEEEKNNEGQIKYVDKDQWIVNKFITIKAKKTLGVKRMEVELSPLSHEIRNFFIDWCNRKEKVDSSLEKIKRNIYFDVKLLNLILPFLSLQHVEGYRTIFKQVN